MLVTLTSRMMASILLLSKMRSSSCGVFVVKLVGIITSLLFDISSFLRISKDCLKVFGNLENPLFDNISVVKLGRR